MTAPSLNEPLLIALYDAIASSGSITAELGSYEGSPSIHTRRPVPEGVEKPTIVIGPMVTRTDDDGVNDYRSIVSIDVLIAGEQKRHYRTVERLADAVFSLFHRKPGSVTVTGWNTTEVRAIGPYPSPTDEDSEVARRVSLTIQLYAGK